MIVTLTETTPSVEGEPVRQEVWTYWVSTDPAGSGWRARLQNYRGQERPATSRRGKWRTVEAFDQYGTVRSLPYLRRALNSKEVPQPPDLHKRIAKILASKPIEVC